jgi:hypothetical protein
VPFPVGRLPGGAIFSGNTAEKFEEADAFKFLALEAK